MKLIKATTRSSRRLTAATCMPYSRLILEIVCIAVGGWLLLDASAALATPSLGGAQ